MKLIKQSNGKHGLKLSKAEWEKIGQNQGWMPSENLPGNQNMHDVVLNHLKTAIDLVTYDKSGPISDMHEGVLAALEDALVDFINANSVP